MDKCNRIWSIEKKVTFIKEMNKSCINYRTNSISRIILVLTLFVGVFTSVFSGNSRSVIDQKVTKTEASITAARKTIKRTISYYRALGLIKVESALYFQLSWKMARLTFDNLTLAKFARLSLRPPLRSSVFSRHLTKMIPHSTDEEKPFIA